MDGSPDEFWTELLSLRAWCSDMERMAEELSERLMCNINFYWCKVCHASTRDPVTLRLNPQADRVEEQLGQRSFMLTSNLIK